MNGEFLQTKPPQFSLNFEDPRSPSAPETETQSPLKQVVVGPGQVPGHLTLGTVHIPFNPNDLMITTWADVQQLFESVFTLDERI